MITLVLHQIVVQFPIAFFTLATVLLGMYLVSKKTEYERFSFLIYGLGYGGTLLAIVAGLVDSKGFSGRPVPHSNLGLLFFLVYSILLLLRWKKGQSLWSSELRFWGFFIVCLGFVLMAATGYEGGEVVMKLMNS